MTTSKRKQPDKRRKKAPPKTAGIALRSLSFAGRLAARNPVFFGGSAAFAVVFSFVAANAMWYQPGVHPSPFLRTRLPFNHPQAASLDTGDETGDIAPRKVTTFVIKREDEIEDADAETATAAPRQAVPRPQPAEDETRPQPVEDETANLIRSASRQVPEATPSTPTVPTVHDGAPLVQQVQKELARRGLYDGPADGRTGPKTEAAIRAFEKSARRAQTGTASADLLAALRENRSTGSLATVRPAQRPSENVHLAKGDLDSVAAAIRDADINPDFIPKVDIPASSEMVVNIQKGLSNLAYTDVTVDGVAGEQTRSAIRHFEKHYRLPETGQPNDKVLKKMKEIGAL